MLIQTVENCPLKVIDNAEVILGLHLNYREVSHSIRRQQFYALCCY
jgi:hypothetical protein